uniref:Uncharacterized protein n=1 Tax=Avena sativa TaxID=4498 RepID=A0ACD5UG02_AVESA
MYYKGVYHLFYQYNSHGPTWDAGTISWGHSVSLDLVNWSALHNALDPNSLFDAKGCWSGSATILHDDGTPIMLYTGVTATGVQVQNLAFPKNASDPHLREWVKPSYNPVIPLPRDVLNDNFRDPSTAWLGRDGFWRVAVSAQIKDSVAASTLIFRSKDFRRWERNAEPLYESGPAGMVECPDLFPVAEPGVQNGVDLLAPSDAAARHVLKLSVMATHQDYYVVGRYDDAADTFALAGADNDCRTWHRFDYGHVYASKSFYDAGKKRRVLWSWANESDPVQDYVARGWAGVQTVPRKIWLDGDGKQLLQWPIEEIETLRIKRGVGLQLGAEVNAGGMKEIMGVAGTQADVEVVFEVPALDGAENLDPNQLLDPQRLCGENGASVRGGVGPFGLLVLASSDLQEHTSVFFRVFRHDGEYKVLMCTDLRRYTASKKLLKYRTDVYKPPYGGFVDIDIQKERSISLRTLIDHSVVESYGGGGRAVITARVYPEHAETSNSRLFMFNNGTGVIKVPKLDAWELKAASIAQ